MLGELIAKVTNNPGERLVLALIVEEEILARTQTETRNEAASVTLRWDMKP